MNKIQKAGTWLAMMTASVISLGNAKDAKAQYPQPGYAPRQFTVMEQTKVVVPYTTWQQQTTMVPQTQWVPQTIMVPQTRMVPQTQYLEQTIQRPVTYIRADQCKPRFPVLNGLGQIIEGAWNFPGEFLQDLTTPCRPARPYCPSRVQYPSPVVPIPPCGCR